MRSFAAIALLCSTLLLSCQLPLQTDVNSSSAFPLLNKPSFESACNPQSENLYFRVYSNTGDQNLYPEGVAYDKKQPIANPQLTLNGTPTGRVAGHVIELKRPAFTESVNLSIAADGFMTEQTLFLDAKPEVQMSTGWCENTYVALSPLSLEEQAGKVLTVDAEKVDASFAIHKDTKTSLQYGITPDLESFERLVSELTHYYKPLSEDQLNTLRKGFRHGDKLLWVGNDSQGFGDLFGLVHRVTRHEKKLIVASHLGAIISEPKPENQPVGDRYRKEYELVWVPEGVETIVLDLLVAGVRGGNKQRLEISVKQATLDTP